MVKATTKKNSEQKQAFTVDESLDIAYHKGSENLGAETHWIEEESQSPPEELDTSENLVHLYLSETRRTPMLTGQEEKRLGSYIEQEKHLAQVTQELTNRYDREPSAVEILSTFLDNFFRAYPFFEALCNEVDIPVSKPVADRVNNSGLIHAIDGYIDPQLINSISQTIGTNTEQTLRALVQLSLDSQLIYWPAMEEARKQSSFAEFEATVKSEPFRARLAAKEADISLYYKQIRNRAREAGDH
jgi:hypothetical protein